MRSDFIGTIGIPLGGFPSASITLRNDEIEFSSEGMDLSLSLGQYAHTIKKHLRGYQQNDTDVISMHGQFVGVPGEANSTFIAMTIEATIGCYVAVPWSSRPLPTTVFKFASQLGKWYDGNLPTQLACPIKAMFLNKSALATVVWYDRGKSNEITNPNERQRITEASWAETKNGKST